MIAPFVGMNRSTDRRIGWRAIDNKDVNRWMDDRQTGRQEDGRIERSADGQNTDSRAVEAVRIQITTATTTMFIIFKLDLFSCSMFIRRPKKEGAGKNNGGRNSPHTPYLQLQRTRSTPRVPLEYSEYLGREGLLDAHEVRQLRDGRRRGRLQPFSRLAPFPLNGGIPT